MMYTPKQRALYCIAGLYVKCTHTLSDRPTHFPSSSRTHIYLVDLLVSNTRNGPQKLMGWNNACDQGGAPPGLGKR